MNAAKKALDNSKGLFPQLNHQKRVIAHSLKKQKVTNESRTGKEEDEELNDSLSRDSKLPKQYRMRERSISEISSSSLQSEPEINSTKRKRKSKKKDVKSPREKEPKQRSSDSINLLYESKSKEDWWETEKGRLARLNDDELSSISEFGDFDDFDRAENDILDSDEDISFSEVSSIRPLSRNYDLPKELKDVTFENSVKPFKVDGGEDVSDLESGELS